MLVRRELEYIPRPSANTSLGIVFPIIVVPTSDPMVRDAAIFTGEKNVKPSVNTVPS
jgi:hypothetical protein